MLNSSISILTRNIAVINSQEKKFTGQVSGIFRHFGSNQHNQYLTEVKKIIVEKKPFSVTKEKKMIKISVDGNISSGKSTLVSKLNEFFQRGKVNGEGKDGSQSKFDLEIVPEPLEKWCNMKGYNLLDMFYKDPIKSNFLFQHYVQLTRLQDTIKGFKSDGISANQEISQNQNLDSSVDNDSARKVRVMERSLQNNRYCFIEMARKNSNLHPAEFTVLSQWYSFVEENLDLQLDLVIYLRTKPETAFARMKKRARADEDPCPLEYLKDLHESYEDWLIRKNVKDLNGDEVEQNVIVLDAEKTKEQVAEECFEALSVYLNLNHS